MSPVWAAVLFHAPGVRWLARRRLAPFVLVLNVLAVGATVAAMVAAPTALGVVGAWAVGHGTWSLVLAALVASGRGLKA